jgi:Na+/melibiose symporter-like transporter
MIFYIFFQFSPGVIFAILGVVFLGALVIFSIYLRKDKISGEEVSTNKYLPFLLQKSRLLRIIFASFALTLIFSVILSPIFIFFFDLETVINYTEKYFGFHFIVFGLLLSPFVAKRLKD